MIEHDDAYVALSYCWGPLQYTSMRTTTSTIDSWTTATPWGRLPRTIQDAALVIYQLGIRFIWVDALCIVQDDQKDKRREIFQMPRIYGQATLTIDAARAKDAQPGFLENRVATEGPKAVFQIPFRCDDGEVGSVILLHAEKQFDSEPLDMRARAMQERLLSPRVLEFGTRQTRWICPRKTEGYSDGTVGHYIPSMERVARKIPILYFKFFNF